MILKQIIDQPTSIPVLLATNLPKSATFFFQYISLRAFAFCGNNFLRISPLIQSLIVCKFIDITPRQKFNRITNLPKIKWGTTFAVYSIYACIGISYSIISPIDINIHHFLFSTYQPCITSMHSNMYTVISMNQKQLADYTPQRCFISILVSIVSNVV